MVTLVGISTSSDIRRISGPRALHSSPVPHSTVRYLITGHRIACASGNKLRKKNQKLTFPEIIFHRAGMLTGT
eukprot:3650353-Rhodomonas_salina.2